jgi:hypothetical protein
LQYVFIPIAGNLALLIPKLLQIDGSANTFEELPEHLSHIQNEVRRERVHERQGSKPPQDSTSGPMPIHPGYPMPPFGYPQYYGNPPPMFQQPPYQQQFLPGMTPAPPPQMPPVNTISFPKIGTWLAYLDLQSERARPDFKFGSLLEKFIKHKFNSVNDLILDPSILSSADFARLLDIEFGIVLPLLQYAKEDVRAIRAGQLTIPTNIASV